MLVLRYRFDLGRLARLLALEQLGGGRAAVGDIDQIQVEAPGQQMGGQRRSPGSSRAGLGACGNARSGRE
jgi:hypothetical protein